MPYWGPGYRRGWGGYGPWGYGRRFYGGYGPWGYGGYGGSPYVFVGNPQPPVVVVSNQPANQQQPVQAVQVQQVPLPGFSYGGYSGVTVL